MQRAARYHPLLVALHWIVAVLSIAALYFGRMHLVKIPNSDPVKIQGLRVHMTVGMLILVLVVARLVVRNVTARPRKADTRPHFLAVLASLSHGLLYVCLMGLTLSGLALGYQGGLFGAVFAHQGTVPPDLDCTRLSGHVREAMVLVADNGGESPSVSVKRFREGQISVLPKAVGAIRSIARLVVLETRLFGDR